MSFKWQWQIVPLFVSLQFTSLSHEFCWWCGVKSKYLKCSPLVCREVAWQNWKYVNLRVHLNYSSFSAILLSLDLGWIIWVLGCRMVHCIINTPAKPQITNFKCGRTHLWIQAMEFFLFSVFDVIKLNIQVRFLTSKGNHTACQLSSSYQMKKHCLPKNKILHSFKK